MAVLGRCEHASALKSLEEGICVRSMRAHMCDTILLTVCFGELEHRLTQDLARCNDHGADRR